MVPAEVVTLISQLAINKWKSSGITEEVAQRLQFKILKAEETAALGKQFLKQASFMIPYFTPEGDRTKFYRVRYLESKGFQASLKKPQRYMQPDAMSEVYLPPLLQEPWEKVLNGSEKLYITEGELKAACGCIYGLPIIGIGGVYNWKSSRHGIELHPTLANIKWNRREIVIVFDSDISENPQVLKAQIALAKELANRGAIPILLKLPHESVKIGLDDFLISRGVEALESLLAEAIPFSEAKELWQLNSEIVYIFNPGLIVQQSTGIKLSTEKFISSAYANRHYTEQIVTPKGKIYSEQKSLARRWIEWEQRFQLNEVTYEPGSERIVNNKWNTWEGWGVEPIKGDIAWWNWLLGFIFKGDARERNWFEKWCAYPLQYPGTKLFTSVILWGVYQGTGKTLIAYTLKRIYGKNGIEIGQQHLQGDFNQWACERQFVIGDEIASTDKRIEADKLKSLITRDEVLINTKFIPQYVLPDCINYLFTSNHCDALFLEEQDRRFFVYEVTGPPEEEENYKKYDVWLKNEGPSALFYHLLYNVNTSDFNPRAHALTTEAKERMIADSRNDMQNWVVALRDFPETALINAPAEVRNKCDLFTTDQLLMYYDPQQLTRQSPVWLGRAMKQVGFKQACDGRTVYTNLGPRRLFVVRNYDEWHQAAPSSAAAHFNYFFKEIK